MPVPEVVGPEMYEGDDAEYEPVVAERLDDHWVSTSSVSSSSLSRSLRAASTSAVSSNELSSSYVYEFREEGEGDTMMRRICRAEDASPVSEDEADSDQTENEINKRLEKNFGNPTGTRRI